jgi:ABC-type transport system substrate-binding protein
MAELNYWARKSLSRRSALRLAAAGGVTLALVGCSGGGDGGEDGSGGGGAADEKVDAGTKGVQGGKFKFHTATGWTNVDEVASRNAAVGGFWSLTNNGLLRLAGGQWGYDAGDPSVEPDLALALPERPDDKTMIFKLRPGVQFHNGRTLTAEDVKYSYETFAKAPAYAARFPWLDKIEAVDTQTVRISMKFPHADAFGELCGFYTGVIAREHQESSSVGSTLMGTGPFKFVEQTAGISVKFERNPNFYLKPFPFFDSLETYLGNEDAKRLADIVSGQVDLPFWFGVNEREQLKNARPDLRLETNQHPSFMLSMRTDVPPYNDVRVRRALSMSMDRTKINQATAAGEGVTDTPFGVTQTYWEPTPPDKLPRNLGKNFSFDIAEAKKLLAAAGITSPIKDTYTHINASGPGGQAVVDTATLAIIGWKAAGIADFNQTEVTSAVSSTTVTLGKYDGVAQNLRAPGTVSLGTDLRDLYYSDSSGPTARNNSRYTNASLNALLDKQQAQANVEERKKTFRQIEEIMAEELAYIPHSTFTIAWFYPPRLQNARMSKIFGNRAYFRNWWWAK